MSNRRTQKTFAEILQGILQVQNESSEVCLIRILVDIPGAWCYTTDPAITMDACNVQDCDKPEQCTVITETKDAGNVLKCLFSETCLLTLWLPRGLLNSIIV